MSKWRSPALRDSGSRRGARTAASRPIGTFTYRTHSQPAHSVSIPPSRTPTAPPEPTAAPQTPIALLRSEPSANSTVTSDSAAGESSAAPRPWTARAATSQPALWASPPASDAAANRSRPAMNRRRRPRMSAIRPPRSRKPPNTSTYALTTHDRSSDENPRSVPIDGSATLTIDASSTTTNWAAASSANATHLLVLLGAMKSSSLGFVLRPYYNSMGIMQYRDRVGPSRSRAVGLERFAMRYPKDQKQATRQR